MSKPELRPAVHLVAAEKLNRPGWPQGRALRLWSALRLTIQGTGAGILIGFGLGIGYVFWILSDGQDHRSPGLGLYLYGTSGGLVGGAAGLLAGMVVAAIKLWRHSAKKTQ